MQDDRMKRAVTSTARALGKEIAGTGGEVAAYDGSVVSERTKGEVSAPVTWRR